MILSLLLFYSCKTNIPCYHTLNFNIYKVKNEYFYTGGCRGRRNTKQYRQRLPITLTSLYPSRKIKQLKLRLLQLALGVYKGANII